MAAHERPRKKAGEIAGLFVALDRREQEFDRPLRRDAFRLQGIREAEATHDEIGGRGAAAVELPIDVLTLAEQRPGRKKRELRRHERAVEVRRSDLNGDHPELPRKEARKRDLELRIREKEDALAGKVTALPCDRSLGP